MLGPILFLIYINDITSHIHSQLRLFADDCLVYCPINSPADHKTFQDDLYKLSVWADVWQMRFNAKKCCILRVSTLHSTSNFIYTMYSIPLQVVEQHHYLGVLIDNKLLWTPHIHSICNKANHLLGFLRRNLHLVHLISKNVLTNRLFYHLLNTVLLYGTHTSKHPSIS